MHDYINRLLTQFKEAKGLDRLDNKSKSLSEEFINFVIERGKNGADFRRFLEYLNLDYYRFSSTVEYGKGNLDSIVKLSNSTVVSPFGYSFEGLADSRIIVSNLVVRDNVPVLVSSRMS